MLFEECVIIFRLELVCVALVGIADCFLIVIESLSLGVLPLERLELLECLKRPLSLIWIDEAIVTHVDVAVVIVVVVIVLVLIITASLITIIVVALKTSLILFITLTPVSMPIFTFVVTRTASLTTSRSVAFVSCSWVIISAVAK